MHIDLLIHKKLLQKTLYVFNNTCDVGLKKIETKCQNCNSTHTTFLACESDKVYSHDHFWWVVAFVSLSLLVWSYFCENGIGQWIIRSSDC